jgi:uncharacterized membrane protein YhaH (DUF805 family)
MSAWYYLHKTQRLGPLELEALRQLRSNGEVGDTTLVWTEGMTDWAPFGQVPALSPTAPPLSSDIYPAITQQPPGGAPPSSLAIAPEDRGGPRREIGWFAEPFLKYAVFNGRARRKEFWLFFLFNLIVAVVLTLLELIFGMVPKYEGCLVRVYDLAILLPSIAVGVRRMHDIGHSGWWFLVPGVNFVFAMRDSQPGANQWGPNPKAA